MVVGTILLTKADKYVDASGNLPKRPSFDKVLLTSLCKNQRVSDEGYSMLPLSIQKIVTVDSTITMPITIAEIAKSDLLIVSRSQEEINAGKVFRFDNFKCLVKDRKVELWIRKN